MAPVATAGSGISLGTVALMGGVIVVAGIAYFIYKNNNKEAKDPKYVNTLINDADRYEREKNIILQAISEQDWEILEDSRQDRSTKDFPDLIKMIEKALKQKK